MIFRTRDINYIKKYLSSLPNKFSSNRGNLLHMFFVSAFVKENCKFVLKTMVIANIKWKQSVKHTFWQHMTQYFMN